MGFQWALSKATHAIEYGEGKTEGYRLIRFS